MISNCSFLFLALQAHIASLEDSANKKIFRFIDHDLGFLDEDIPKLSYPACLIDMDNFRFTDMSGNCQMGSGMVRLKVIFAPYSETNNLTPDKWKVKGLNYYEIEELLHRAMQGWQPAYQVLVTPADPDADPPTEDVYEDALEYFGAFDRVSNATDQRRKDLRVRHLVYSIGFEDYGTRNVIVLSPAEPLIEPEPLPELEDEVDGEIVDL